MIRGFYTARSGLINHQENMNVISNNMANVNTVGYKTMRSSFTDLVYQNLNRTTAPAPAEIGHGVKINKIDYSTAQGALNPTNRTFDLAILEENAYFAVRVGEGEDDIRYTRAGNFYISNDDDELYLVNSSGYRVLDEDGEEIEIDVDEFGNIYMLDEDGEETEFDPALLVGVYRLPNPASMINEGGTLWRPTDETGEAEALEEPKVQSGYLENSNVEISQEMVNMIESSKAFSFNSRMIQVTDEMEQIVNNLR